MVLLAACGTKQPENEQQQQQQSKMEKTDMKKMVILNASPRMDKNTATLLKEAQRGAEEVGAVVEYYDLIDLQFSGCRSCMACKRTGNKCDGVCVVRDDLRPVLESIRTADALIIGSPIYWSYPTGMMRNVVERLLFPILRYDLDTVNGGAMKYIDHKMACGLIYTMNNTEERYKLVKYDVILDPDRQYIEHMFGHCEVLNAFDTWQFYPDYEPYDHSAIDVASKQRQRDNQWPKDKQAAYEMGKRLVED